MCEAVAEIMYRIMANPNVDHSVDHVLEKACRALPSRDQEKVSEHTLFFTLYITQKNN